MLNMHTAQDEDDGGEDILSTTPSKKKAKAPKAGTEAKKAAKKPSKAVTTKPAAKAAAKPAKAAAKAAPAKAKKKANSDDDVSTTQPDDKVVLAAVRKLKEATLAAEFASNLGVHRRVIRNQLQRLAKDKANGVKMAKDGFNWYVSAR